MELQWAFFFFVMSVQSFYHDSKLLDEKKEEKIEEKT